jgi:hypothetical protein
LFRLFVPETAESEKDNKPPKDSTGGPDDDSDKGGQEMIKEVEETSQGRPGIQAPDRIHGIGVLDQIHGIGSLDRIRGNRIPVQDLGLGLKDGVLGPRADHVVRALLYGPRAAQRATSSLSRP